MVVKSYIYGDVFRNVTIDLLQRCYSNVFDCHNKKRCDRPFVFTRTLLVFCDVLQMPPKPRFLFVYKNSFWFFVMFYKCRLNQGFCFCSEYFVCFDEKLYMKIDFFFFFSFSCIGSIKTKWVKRKLYSDFPYLI